MLDGALLDAANGVEPRLLFTMPPQEGKSVRVSRWFVLWLLVRNPDLRIGIVSYSDRIARRWGRAVRNDIKTNPGLGITVSADTAAANEWQIAGHDGGVITTGIQGSLTGRPLDVLIIDDPLKGQKEADSETYREHCKEFWRSTGSARLSEDAIVVVIQTRWHEDDLTGWLLTEDHKGWRYINIPALADHSPEKGETDPLGRQPGEWMQSARRRTVRGWLRRQKDAGSRAFTALFQGHPSPAEGTLFKRGDWQSFSTALIHVGPDGACRADGMEEILQSWDMAFKDAKGSSYVVGQVWGRKGADVYLLDQVRDRMDFPATCRALEALTAKWPQANAKLVEDKANGPAVISQLRSRVAGLIAITPKDSKYGRASAIAPFVEAHNVHLPDPSRAAWVSDFIEECAGFPLSAHDDQVDAMSQAVSRMLGDQGSADQAMEWLQAFKAAA